jgi:hypothetical protein
LETAGFLEIAPTTGLPHCGRRGTVPLAPGGAHSHSQIAFSRPDFNIRPRIRPIMKGIPLHGWRANVAFALSGELLRSRMKRIPHKLDRANVWANVRTLIIL